MPKWIVTFYMKNGQKLVFKHLTDFNIRASGDIVESIEFTQSWPYERMLMVPILSEIQMISMRPQNPLAWLLRWAFPWFYEDMK